ncbi:MULTISPECIES: polysaccharide pyruvyl transferase family protein [Chryseobacterium]|uniref:polysaccharide pyruvyl transferase family protein n=1 Tax=Chryseobacterium TaxID=59732 RepID=UPI001BE5B41E|nr:MULTISPECIES: polysaccharide pyruvyl transferase family protein [Chryseobacterium]MBT2622945.1 polysaccharide pyruvyl transferase family protein [Chryseobacterium sp. ISL-6]
MKNKIVYIVATQYDNVGDLLINKCLIDQISRFGQVYLDTRNVPERFKKELLKDTQNVKELSEITNKSFKGKSVVPLYFSNLGITHIFKSPGPFGSAGNKKVFLKNMLIGVIFKIFKSKGVKSYLVGNDVHYKNELDKRSVNFFSKNTEKILCRSYTNVNALKGLGFKNIDYIPDMCFGYSPKDIVESESNEIGVSFRRLNDENYHRKIVDAIQNILDNTDKKVTFFYQVNHDFEYNNELFTHFKNNQNVSFHKDCLQWDSLSFYNKFSFTLSNRLHVLLLGMVYNVIPIGLLNNDLKTQKIIDIFDGVDLNDFLVSELTKEAIEALILKEQELKQLIKEVTLEQKTLIENKIFELIEK